jgi:spectinomycin phosphotransferase
VLIAEDNSLYIVDWDVQRHTMLAPKERDLMFIGAGIGNVWNKHSEEALFYQGYGDTHINMNLLAYYRYERIVEDIAEYVQLLLLSTEGGENRQVMYQHFIDMFEPYGVINKAIT